MQIRAAEISDIIREQIKDYEKQLEVRETGMVLSAGDGIARIYGLDKAAAGELIEFPHGIFGIVLNLEEDNVGAAILGEQQATKEGDEVRRTGRIAEVPVGEALLGRVVNALGQPEDGKGPIKTTATRRIELKAPGIVARQPVKEPLQTGIKAIDAMIPIGRGQRELINGDRQTGKTAVALDTIINQRGGDVHCFYVAIGQKRSTVAQVVDRLAREGAMDYTTVVVASASEPAPLQFIAPYSGCSMGEFFRDSGRHALVIYDDLSKHATAYRQLSLLPELAQFREMAAFAQFGSDLDASTKRQLDRGQRLVEVMKQGQFVPLPVEKQIAIIYAATSGHLDRLPVAAVQRYEHELYAFLDAKHADVPKVLREKKELTDDVKAKLDAALTDFDQHFKA